MPCYVTRKPTSRGTDAAQMTTELYRELATRAAHRLHEATPLVRAKEACVTLGIACALAAHHDAVAPLGALPPETVRRRRESCSTDVRASAGVIPRRRNS